MLQKWALVILCLGGLKGVSEFTASLAAFGSPGVLQRESVSMLTSPGGRLLFHFIWFSELVLVGGNFLSSISPSLVLSKNFGPGSQEWGFLRIFAPHHVESKICMVSIRIQEGRNLPDCLSVVADLYFVSVQKSLQKQKTVTSV